MAKRCGCRLRFSGSCLRMDHSSARVWVRCAGCGRRQRNVRSGNGKPKPCVYCGEAVAEYDPRLTV